ncbi:MAG: hypothetical protein ACR2MP_15115 [Streptosporangiaceae bacterium]
MAASEVDPVIDYLWGKPTTDTIMALLRARADRSRALNWIQIGPAAGPDIQLPSVGVPVVLGKFWSDIPDLR